MLPRKIKLAMNNSEHPDNRLLLEFVREDFQEAAKQMGFDLDAVTECIVAGINEGIRCGVFRLKNGLYALLTDCRLTYESTEVGIMRLLGPTERECVIRGPLETLSDMGLMAGRNEAPPHKCCAGPRTPIPIEPGVYWFRTDHRQKWSAVTVFWSGSLLGVDWPGRDFPYLVKNMHGEWHGPIVKPSDE